MTERYSRLYTLPKNLYTTGAPVVIAAGTLLKDTQTGGLVGQLKLRSISSKRIKAVTVRLDLYDTAGNSVGEPIDYDYMDLNVSRNDEFGQKNPILISQIRARAYSACVTEVIFDDRSIWTGSNDTWTSLPENKLLHFYDIELSKQYKLQFGSKSDYEPKEVKDLWYCTCGALNHLGENCHICGNNLFELQCLDMEKLKAEKDARLAMEAEDLARKQAEREAVAAEKKNRTIKYLKIIIPTICVLAVLVLGAVFGIPAWKYHKAITMMNQGEFDEAIARFMTMADYKDSKEKIREIERIQKELEWEKSKEEYDLAVQLMEECEYELAIAIFEQLGSFEDSEALLQTARYEKQYENQAEVYAVAEELLSQGKAHQAAVMFGNITEYKDARARSLALWDNLAVRDTIAAGSYHSVALKNDGTVVSVGENRNDYAEYIKVGQCDVEDWKDIIAISAGGYHTLGLKANGTVVATGFNEYGQCNVAEWTDIVAISSSEYHSAGLKMDGTVVAVGINDENQCNVSDWTDIIAIYCDAYGTTGLKNDGSIVTTGYSFGAENWKNIQAIAVGSFHMVGLTPDGKVTAVGDNEDGSCNVDNWEDIVALCSGGWNTIGLKRDGTVVAAGFNEDGQCNVKKWKDIVAVSANIRYTIGLKSDGTVVFAGSNICGRGDVGKWKNIKLPN